VVGAGTEYPEDALSIARRAKELGLLSTVGIVHDETGRLRPLNDVQQKVIADIDRVSKPLFSFIRYNPWRANLAQGLPNDWHCPAGGRHVYICENGLVHYCMAQRGYPAIPLSQYTFADVERESKAKKSCAPFAPLPVSSAWRFSTNSGIAESAFTKEEKSSFTFEASDKS
jgi:MoaA/NifB/PqqE/SkfB family radical SAM enzyme